MTSSTQKKRPDSVAAHVEPVSSANLEKGNRDMQEDSTATPEINRRKMMLGIAASGAALTVTAAAMSEARSASIDEINEIDENPELVDAWKEFRAAETEYYASKGALSWLADEWKHLWPLAPEEILGNANAHIHGSYSDDIERDIIGRPMMRDTSVLTKQLSKEFRQKSRETAFFIDQPDKLAERIREFRKSKPRGRTPRSLERNRKWRKEAMANMQNRLHVARAYHAETRRIRALAGVDAAKQRIKTAEDRFDAAAVAVSKVPSRTLVGLRLKADVLSGALERWKFPHNDGFVFGAIWRLVEDTLDATRHLNGKRTAAPLPALEGGAA